MIKLMSKYMFRLSAFIFMAALIQACGFTPVHKTSSGLSNHAYSNVKIVSLNGKNPDDKEAGFHIKQNMIDRIGQGDGTHILEITPTLIQRRQGITGDDIASRFEISLTAGYRLVDNKTGEVLTKGGLRSISSFGSPTDPYGRISAEESAAERLATSIADDLIIALSKYYADEDS